MSRSTRGQVDAIELVRGMRAGEPAAMEGFLDSTLMARVRRVLSTLFGGARAEVDDAIQEGCLKLWAAASSFEGTTEAACERWVFRIFANAARDLQRRQLRSSDVECAATAWSGRPEPEFDTAAAEVEVEDSLRRLKEILAERLRGRERSLLLADLDFDRVDGDTVLALNLETTKQNLRTMRCRVRKKLGADRQISKICSRLMDGSPPPTAGAAFLA